MIKLSMTCEIICTSTLPIILTTNIVEIHLVLIEIYISICSSLLIRPPLL
jgi:hypothetical protein